MGTITLIYQYQYISIFKVVAMKTINKVSKSAYDNSVVISMSICQLRYDTFKYVLRKKINKEKKIINEHLLTNIRNYL